MDPGTQSAIPAWAGDLHELTGEPWAGLLALAGAVVCGAMIGVERQRKHKPAGLRTILLICLGSTVFTLASRIAGQMGGDPGRIASQIVPGIGFLGAGAILREHGSIVGLTTAATIWAIASIGVLLGLGYVVAGVALSGVLYLTLSAVIRVETLLNGRCRCEAWELCFEPRGGRTWVLLQTAVGEHVATPIRLERLPHAPGENVQRARLSLCVNHPQHFGLLRELLAIDAIVGVRPLAAAGGQGEQEG